VMDAVRLSWRSADGQPPGVRNADGGLAARHRRWRFRRELFRSCRSTEAGHPGCCTSLLWQFAGYDGALAAGATFRSASNAPFFAAAIDRFQGGLKRQVLSSAETGPPFRCGVLGVVRAGLWRYRAGSTSVLLFPRFTAPIATSLHNPALDR